LIGIVVISAFADCGLKFFHLNNGRGNDTMLPARVISNIAFEEKITRKSRGGHQAKRRKEKKP
jgi:hypothetical protein